MRWINDLRCNWNGWILMEGPIEDIVNDERLQTWCGRLMRLTRSKRSVHVYMKNIAGDKGWRVAYLDCVDGLD